MLLVSRSIASLVTLRTLFFVQKTKCIVLKLEDIKKDAQIRGVHVQEEAGYNAWVKAALQSLKRYARSRDRDRMSKEAIYMSRKMSNRLAQHNEDSRSYLQDAESNKATFLRRTQEQGERFNPRR